MTSCCLCLCLCGWWWCLGSGGLYFPGETGESWWWQCSTSLLSPVSGLRTHLTTSLHPSSKSHPVRPAAQSNISRLRALNIKESWSGICPSRFPLNIYFFIEKRLKTVSMTWWHHVEVKGPAATTIQGTRLIIRLRIISIMYYCSMCIYSSFYTNISSSFDF